DSETEERKMSTWQFVADGTAASAAVPQLRGQRQGPLSAITQNNGDSMVLVDCAQPYSSLTQEEAEWLSRIKMRSLYQLLLFFPCCLFRTSWRCSQRRRRMAGLCLADLSPIAGFAGASVLSLNMTDTIFSTHALPGWRWGFRVGVLGLWLCLSKVSDGRGENKERKEERSARKRREREEKAVLLVELSGRRAGRRGVRWQESGTAAQLCFCVEGPSRLVSLYFIVREKKGRETQETYDVQRVRSRLG
ncbi:hypothetical protein KUCAC02_017240, partial [Chaenocephalus aceratus]